MIPVAPDAPTTIFLLFIAALVAIAARRLSFPPTAGLLLCGFALAFFRRLNPKIGLDSHTLFFVLLPPLVFEGALNIRWAELRRDLTLLATMTTAGVVVACVVVAAGMHGISHWPWEEALLFGALIAATDPISVLASFKDAGIGGRSRLLLEAESLLNDGTAVVLYAALQGNFATLVFTGHAVTDITLSMARVVAGSVVVGLAVGYAMWFLAGRTADALTETTLTVVAAYGAYYLAEQIHGTGILASLSAGLVMGNMGATGEPAVSAKGREVAEAFWEFAAFIANSLVFLLMGIYLGHRIDAIAWPLIPIAIIVALAGRAATVYMSCALFGRTARRVPIALQNVLFWGGQRGGLSLVLALGLAATADKRSTDVMTAVIAVVAFSVLVQGLTFKTFLRSALRSDATW